MGTSLLKARCTGRQRNRTAEVTVLTALSLATRTGYKRRPWVGHTDSRIPSSSADRLARDLCPGGGVKGELCGSDAKVGDGKKNAALSRL